MSSHNGFDSDMIETLVPELTVFVGLLLIMIVPNLGNGTFRVPGTSIRLPWFLGGTRYKAVASPRLPGLLAVLTMALALFQVCLLYTSPSPRDQRGSGMPASA